MTSLTPKDKGYSLAREVLTMPRKSRDYVPGMPVHVVQRGNNRQTTFIQREDFQCYLKHLAVGLKRYDTALHAYCLMSNHVHLLMTPAHEDSISRTIQHMGRHYVLWFNRKYQRSGTLWEGRHKGKVIVDDRYLLACYRYIEMNPIEAGIVRSPEQYRWSSYSSNALGDGDLMLTAHSIYQELASSDEQRQRQYRMLFEEALKEKSLVDGYTDDSIKRGRDDEKYYLV